MIMTPRKAVGAAGTAVSASPMSTSASPIGSGIGSPGSGTSSIPRSYSAVAMMTIPAGIGFKKSKSATTFGKHSESEVSCSPSACSKSVPIPSEKLSLTAESAAFKSEVPKLGSVVPQLFWLGMEDSEHIQRIFTRFSEFLKIQTTRSGASRAPIEFIGSIHRTVDVSCLQMIFRKSPKTSSFRSTDLVRVFQRDYLPIGEPLKFLRSYIVETTWDVNDGVPLKVIVKKMKDSEISCSHFDRRDKSSIHHSYFQSNPLWNSNSVFTYSSKEEPDSCIGIADLAHECIHRSLPILRSKFGCPGAPEKPLDASDVDGVGGSGLQVVCVISEDEIFPAKRVEDDSSGIFSFDEDVDVSRPKVSTADDDILDYEVDPIPLRKSGVGRSGSARSCSWSSEQNEERCSYSPTCESEVRKIMSAISNPFDSMFMSTSDFPIAADSTEDFSV